MLTVEKLHEMRERVGETDPIADYDTFIAEIHDLREALRNLALTMVLVCEQGDEHMRSIALTETSPLIDGARDVIRKFDLADGRTVESSLPHGEEHRG
jgi:hypothetical protein